MSTATTEKAVIEEIQTRIKAERKVKEVGPRYAIGVMQSEDIYLFTYGKDSEELLRISDSWSLTNAPKFSRTPKLLESYVIAYRDGLMANQQYQGEDDVCDAMGRFRANVLIAKFYQGKLVSLDQLNKSKLG